VSLFRAGKLAVPDGTSAEEVNTLLKDAAYLQVCGKCTLPVNTTTKKRDQDVPLFCACCVSAELVQSPSSWPYPSWRHIRCIRPGVRVASYKYSKLSPTDQWCVFCTEGALDALEVSRLHLKRSC